METFERFVLKLFEVFQKAGLERPIEFLGMIVAGMLLLTVSVPFGGFTAFALAALGLVLITGAVGAWIYRAFRFATTELPQHHSPATRVPPTTITVPQIPDGTRQILPGRALSSAPGELATPGGETGPQNAR